MVGGLKKVDNTTGEDIWSVGVSGSWQYGVAVSPCGQYVYCGNNSGYISIINTENGDVIDYVRPTGNSGHVFSIATTSSGNIVYGNGSSVAIIDKNLEIIAHNTEHTNNVNDVRIDRVGNYIYSFGQDRRIKKYDMNLNIIWTNEDHTQTLMSGAIVY